MTHQGREKPPKTIIRQNEVLRRTGLSRSSLYARIAKGEFPHQVSLGARSVGWIEEEVDAWIAKRANMRPASESSAWLLDDEPRSNALLNGRSQSAQPQNRSTRHSSRMKTPKSRGDLSIPDLAQLELIGTNVYVDKATGTLWFQLLRTQQFAD